MTLVVVVVLGVSTATSFALRRFLYLRLDEQLATLADVDHAGFYFTPSFSYRGRVARDIGRVWAIAFDASGNTVLPNAALAAPMTVTSQQATSLQRVARTRPVSITTGDGKHLRVLVVEAGAILSSQGISVAHVAIGVPVDDVTRTLHRLLRLELVIGIVAVAATIVFSNLGVRIGLRSLRRVTNVAQSVAAHLSDDPTCLDQRVEIANSDADTDVGQLALSLNGLITETQRQLEARSCSEQRMRQFLLDASHELRTPLTSLRGYAELARMHHATASHKETNDVADHLARIETEGVRMSQLVDDLLALARTDDGVAFETARVELADIVTDVIDGALAAHPDRVIRSDLHATGAVVHGNADALHRAVRNLVDNAIIHGADSEILVRLSTDSARATIEVTDRGPGLTPQQAARVFDRFWRADESRTRASGGAGLGLAIVASIVRQHRGETWFRSSPGLGSLATIRLPISSGGVE